MSRGQAEETESLRLGCHQDWKWQCSSGPLGHRGLTVTYQMEKCTQWTPQAQKRKWDVVHVHTCAQAASHTGPSPGTAQDSGRPCSWSLQSVSTEPLCQYHSPAPQQQSECQGGSGCACQGDFLRGARWDSADSATQWLAFSRDLQGQRSSAGICRLLGITLEFSPGAASTAQPDCPDFLTPRQCCGDTNIQSRKFISGNISLNVKAELRAACPFPQGCSV